MLPQITPFPWPKCASTVRSLRMLLDLVERNVMQRNPVFANAPNKKKWP